MKIITNRNFSLLFIALLALIVLISLYYSSLLVIDYQEKESRTEHIELIMKLDTLLNSIEEEQLYSAVYLGTKEKKDLDKVKTNRNLVNIEIATLLKELDKNSIYLPHQERLNTLFQNIYHTRLLIDKAKQSYHSILIENHYKKIINPIIELITQLMDNVSLTDYPELSFYKELSKVKENHYMERSFIAFILSRSQPMNDKDLLTWESFVKKNHTLDFNQLKGSDINSKVYNIINLDYFSKILNHQRAEILKSSRDGEYVVPTNIWIEIFVSKIDKIKSAQSSLFKHIQTSITDTRIEMKDKIMTYLGASLFFLLLLFTLMLIFRNNSKNSKFLAETLKDLEATLDEKQKREIKEVIKKHDTIEIYKFLANAIKEPSRAKDHFLANMSHEIRTPLNGIVGFTNILKESDLREDQQEFVDIIEESSQNLIRIVNDILDFSKVNSGKIELEKITFNVMEKFEATIDAYAAKAGEKNILLGLFIDPNLPTELIGDPAKISQVLTNLLSNAVKFTKEEGEVDIIVEKLSENRKSVTLKFSVKDSGIGIGEHQQSKIFDAFSQADASTSRKFGGTGLGLTISSKFVELMGGKLEIKSIVGEGSTFFFSLTLKKLSVSKKREESQFTHLTTAYITDNNEPIKEVEKYLQTYITHTGASFKRYNKEEIDALDSTQLPKILFIDHLYFNTEEKISKIIARGTKVVLMSTAEIEKCNCPIKNKISKVLYKPINYSKIVRTLKLANTPSLPENQKVTEVKKQNIDKIFSNIKALVVEDNIINQKLIQTVLRNFGMVVSVANNGLEALNLRKENQYDIIFMDIQMPIMSGVESTQKILEYEQNNQKNHIPIVALTANINQNDKEKYLSSGMDKYLKKPINIGELTTILEAYFPLQELRDTLILNKKEKSTDGKKSHIILYKETPLTAKIYSAVLSNLGYIVDKYSSEDKFLEQLNNSHYAFALFDAKPFRKINADSFVVDLIRESGATPIAFVEKDNNSQYCETLQSVGTVEEIQEKLMR